jgi:glutamyl/glutaminyl-tRNA synthetase
MTTIVTRFAPSPTGRLHIGGARTALFCWALARHAGGRFLLRLEDTDQARSSEASAREILEDLAWLGLDWDDGPELTIDSRTFGGDSRGVGPYRQSERLDIYNTHVDRLIAEGKAYAAFDTPEELDAKRKAAIAEKRQYRYDRAALQLAETERVHRIEEGEPHVVRLRTPDEGITVHDEVLGDVVWGPNEVDDFIIRKRDGFPTYHLAVVIDDALMGVTHVLRGQEHLINTPKHVLLQQALGFDTPIYAHMPLIFNEKGAKMSKRERDVAARAACKDQSIEQSPTPAIDDATFTDWLADKKKQLEPDEVKALADAIDIHLPEVSVADFREAGYLPEVVDNFIALLGWTPSKHDDGSDREKFDLDFLARDFDVARIGKSNARFDRTKLAAFNADAIQAMDDDTFAGLLRDWAAQYDPGLIETFNDRWSLLARASRPRCKTFGDVRTVVAFALTGDDDFDYDDKAVKKFIFKGEPSGLELLGAFRQHLPTSFAPEDIEEAVSSFAEAKGVGMGKIAQPLRIALTGAGVSPPLGETLALLGRETVERRIARCMHDLSARQQV